MNRPLSYDECNCFALRQAARHVTQMYERHLSGVGLTAAQFTILAKLARTPNLPMAELADAMVMERTTLVRAMKPLQRDGLVLAEAADHDNRTLLFSLTEKGETTFDQASVACMLQGDRRARGAGTGRSRRPDRRQAAGQGTARLRDAFASVSARYADEPRASRRTARMGAKARCGHHRGRLRLRVPFRRPADGAAEESRSRWPRRLRRHVFEDDLPRIAHRLPGAARVVARPAAEGAADRRLSRLHADANGARVVHAPTA